MRGRMLCAYIVAVPAASVFHLQSIEARTYIIRKFLSDDTSFMLTLHALDWRLKTCSGSAGLLRICMPNIHVSTKEKRFIL